MHWCVPSTVPAEFSDKAGETIMLEKSCGTVPVTLIDGEVRYLLIRARHDGYCGFPKGHVEAGETEAETAFRETWEETSIKPQIDTAFRAETEYRLKNGNIKQVVYFLGIFADQEPKHNDGFESLEYLLLPFKAAHRALTFENAKNILKQADDYIRETYRKLLS